MIDAMKTLMEKLCIHLSGSDGIALTIVKDIDTNADGHN